MSDEFDRMMEENDDMNERFREVKREHLDEVLADIDNEQVIEIRHEYLPGGEMTLTARQALMTAMIVCEPFNMASTVSHVSDVVDAINMSKYKEINFSASLLQSMSHQLVHTYAWSSSMDSFLIKQRALIAAYELGFVDREDLEPMLAVGVKVLIDEVNNSVGEQTLMEELDEKLAGKSPFEVLEMVLDGDTADLPFGEDDDIIGDTFRMCDDLGIPYDEAKARGGDKAYVAELIVQCFATMNDISPEAVRKAFGEER